MEKLVILSLVFALSVGGAKSVTFTFTNKCTYTVWAGTLNNHDKPPLAQTGFKLDPSESVALEAPAGWAGRMWGRTGCSTDATGKFSCVTADCGSGMIPCNGAGGAPPATLVEITLGGSSYDSYDVSLVDGFNMPFAVTPQGGTGTCSVSSCPADVNAICPAQLRSTGPDGSTVGCKSACEAFNTDEYCCRGEFEARDKCKPSEYSMIFKNACPLAYSYAHDDTATLSCTGANYLLTYCPS